MDDDEAPQFSEDMEEERAKVADRRRVERDEWRSEEEEGSYKVSSRQSSLVKQPSSPTAASSSPSQSSIIKQPSVVSQSSVHGDVARRTSIPQQASASPSQSFITKQPSVVSQSSVNQESVRRTSIPQQASASSRQSSVVSQSFVHQESARKTSVPQQGSCQSSVTSSGPRRQSSVSSTPRQASVTSQGRQASNGTPRHGSIPYMTAYGMRQASIGSQGRPTEPPKFPTMGSRQSSLVKQGSSTSQGSSGKQPPSRKGSDARRESVRSGGGSRKESQAGGAIAEESAAAGEAIEEATEEHAPYYYDENYPGYRWNYATQAWEEDVPTTAVEGAEVQQEGHDPNATYNYDQQQDADGQDYSAYYAGYDQNGEQTYDSSYQTGEHATTNGQQQYDYSQYPGYDQATYDQYYQQGGDQYNAGYDQPGDGTTATSYQFDYAAPVAGHDQPGDGTTATSYQYDYTTPVAGHESTHDQAAYAGYDQQQGGYGYSNYYQDQQAYAQQGYEVTAAAATDQTLSVNTAYDAYQGAYEGYGGQPVGAVTPTGYPSNDTSPYPEASSSYHESENDPYAWGNTSQPAATEVTHDETAPPVEVEELDRTKEAVEGETEKKAPPPRPPAASPARPVPPRPAAPAAVSPGAPPPVPAPPVARPPPPKPAPPPPKKEEEPEEDAWTRFNKMTAKVTAAVKSTESTLKNLEDHSAVDDIKDESYLATVGGEQGYFNAEVHKTIQNKKEELAKEKAIKKKMKARGKKSVSPPLDPDHEDDMDKKAMELAAKLASNRPEFEDWRPDIQQQAATAAVSPAVTAIKKDSTASGIPPRKRSSIKDAHQDSGSLDFSCGETQSVDGVQPIGDLPPNDPSLAASRWADNFDNMQLPASDSGFFLKGESDAADPFVVTKEDPFAPKAGDLIDENFDPFAVKSVEEIMAAAKAKAEVIAASRVAHEDDDVYDDRRSDVSTPTEPGSPANGERPHGFDDEFKVDPSGLSTPTPLYDEDDSQPLEPYIPPFTGDGFELMIRHPLKKKLMADRFWKPCYVRIHGNSLLIFNDKNDPKPLQEILLQASYSMSDTTLQAYDVYGKLHTVKLQYVQYKERVGIRQGQIARLMEGHLTKYGMPLEHAAQCTVLAKFGCLNAGQLQSFIAVVEDILFHCPTKRDGAPAYKQDEVQVHCYDEYSCYVDKDGVVSDQKARVRMFCLAFVSGRPMLEIGLNDRRREGKEIVRRKDILPMYTERWIRFENLEFHSIVDKPAFESEQVIRIPPPDGCFFELMRFRVRPPRNREKNLTVKALMKIAGSKVEIRIEAMAAAHSSKSRGTNDSRRTIPCEDICIRFPIPEAWIYIFREERHWGVGSVHAKKMKPGKVKNLKDRLLGAVQQMENHLIEVATGEAKYEHVYRSLVWRIPRLPKEQQEAYKSYMLKCRFELSSFDLMPDEFLPSCEAEFTMPLATISNTVVRSISVEQHEDPDRVEKFVRYVARSTYKVEIDYVQCADLDAETTLASKPHIEDLTMPDMHQPAIHPDEVKDMHEGYRIDLPEEARYERRTDSSSDDEDEKDNRKMPMVKIDMSNYGY